ncbi:MAG: hypothetical protein GW938_08535 [Leptospira sp.]|jgi:hypothetical protein|nr:hypothetical protein [Leptospira sp.]
MKNMNLKLLLAASLVVAFATSCTQSSAESKDDPAILQYAATQIANANAVNLDDATGVCLANVAAMNTCVGGTATGEGFSGELCSAPDTTRAQLSTSGAAACVGAVISETSCNLSENKFLDAAAAKAGGFDFTDTTTTFGKCIQCAGLTSGTTAYLLAGCS